MVNFEGSIIFLKFNPICNFLTINFYENLQEYFFVHNQFLILKNFIIYLFCEVKHIFLAQKTKNVRYVQTHIFIYMCDLMVQ